MAGSKVGAVFVVLAAGFCVWGASPEEGMRPGSNVVVMEVNGVPVTMTDVEQKRASALFEARTTYYEAERKVLTDLADQALLEQQAAKEGLTIDQLLQKHVDATLAKDPTDDVLRVFYEGLDTTQPFDAVRDKMIDAIRQRRVAKAKAAYMQSLRTQASIVIRLAPPRALFSLKDVPVREDGSPKVTLLEYADYEYPYCQQAEPVVAKLEAEFKGKIAFVFKDYPLPMHSHAEKAAEAAHCAAAQGKYWEYHDLMFANKQLEVSALKKDAADLKLDTAAFDACLDSGKMADAVKEQAKEAQSLSLPGTPSFFVNGRAISGSLTFERIHAVIDEELSAISHEESEAAPAKPVAESHPNAPAQSH